MVLAAQSAMSNVSFTPGTFRRKPHPPSQESLRQQEAILKNLLQIAAVAEGRNICIQRLWQTLAAAARIM